MNSPDHAVAQLQTIRTLLERATIYRAISVPGAAVGGVAGVLLAGVAMKMELTGPVWLGAWLVLLVVLAVGNVLALAYQAKQDARPLFSSSMLLALRGLVPPLLAGGAVGICLAWAGEEFLAASVWALFYGLALLATQEFAPRSIVWLGRAFFLAGLLALVGELVFQCREGSCPAGVPASLFMAASFGFFHIFYAAAVTFTARRRARHD